MGFDIKKFIKGFNIFNGEIIGKVIWMVVMLTIVAGIGYGVYKLIARPQTVDQSTTQEAETITNVEENKDDFNLIKIKILGWGN